MGRYIVSTMSEYSQGEGDLKKGFYRIVEADTAAEAKKIGVEQLKLDGKLRAGKSMYNVRVEKYTGKLGQDIRRFSIMAKQKVKSYERKIVKTKQHVKAYTRTPPKQTQYNRIWQKV